MLNLLYSFQKKNPPPIGACTRPHIFCRESSFSGAGWSRQVKTHSVLYPTHSTYTELHNVPAYRFPLASNQLRQIPPVSISQTPQASTQQLQTSLQPWELPDPYFRGRLGNPPDISLPAQLIDVVLDCFSRLHPHFPVASESNRRLPSALEASTRATHDTVPTYMTSSLQRWGRLSENSFGVLFRRLPPLLGSALSERQRKKPRLSPIPGLPCMHCPQLNWLGGIPQNTRLF